MSFQDTRVTAEVEPSPASHVELMSCSKIMYVPSIFFICKLLKLHVQFSLKHGPQRVLMLHICLTWISGV